MRSLSTTLIIFLAVLVPAQDFAANSESAEVRHLFGDDEIVDFYPTYGYLDGETWVIPVKMYVYEHRKYIERILVSIVKRHRKLSAADRDIFQSRIRVFAADSESRETVEFVFDRDPENEIFSVRDSAGTPLRTNLNGIVEGEIRMPAERAAALIEAQNSVDNWLTISVVSDEHTGRGKVRLIGHEGVSVISDIDDTIKITEMPAGSRIAVRNAFFKDYAAAPGMTDLYRQWNGIPVHYVSGTPRQFYRPLSEFLFSGKAPFPPGTFHMRDVKKNLLSRSTWRDLEKLIFSENVTYNHKFEQIAGIVRNFPGREFILVGDSGEYDPEIFREIADSFPGQVREIIIRDVVNAREHSPQRLEGMTVIEANTVEYGVSEFDL